VESSEAAADSARAGYHQAERDLDRAVRALFATCIEAEQEIVFRRAGSERLRSYGSVIESRHAGGQGVASDFSKTNVRLGVEEANVADAERRRDELKLELNELMGRTPDSVLELAPLPAPEVPASVLTDEPWLRAPEIAQAEAEQRAAAASVGAALADWLPQVSLMVDAGAQPVWGNSKLALLNNGVGWGGEMVLSVSLPLWDAGVRRSRLTQAELAEKAAKQRLTVTQRGVRLAWQRAVTGLNGLHREVEARTRTVATARDSYLQAESLYRGGVGTALDVLDAYDAWIGANQAYAEAVLRQRVAEADLVRWGTP
jgi:multidrug efflux system outer membrane protein